MFYVYSVEGFALLLRDLLCGLRRQCDSDLFLSLLHFELIQWHLAQYFDVHVFAYMDYILSGYLQYEWWAMTYPELRWTLLMGLRHPDVAWSTLMGGWWTSFRWFPSLFTSLQLPTYPYLDVRFQLEGDINLPFYVFRIRYPCALQTHRSRCPSQPRHFGTHARVRWRHQWFPVRHRGARTPSERDAHSSDQARTIPVSGEPELDPWYEDWTDYWDNWTDVHPDIEKTQLKLKRQSVSPRVVGSLLEVVDMLDLIDLELENPTGSTLNNLALHIQSQALRMIPTWLMVSSPLQFGDLAWKVNVARADLAKEPRFRPLSITKGAHGYLSLERINCDTPIIFDTGCSFSLTPYKTDFVSEIQMTPTAEMDGINNSIKIEGVGWIEWDIVDYNNQIARIRTQAYYVPEAEGVRLFSPQTYFQENVMEATSCWFNSKFIRMLTADGIELVFPFDRRNNIPHMLESCDVNEAGLTSQQVLNFSRATDEDLRSQLKALIDDVNYNLTKSQKELLLWHFRLGHLGQAWIQDLMKKIKTGSGETEEPVIPTTEYPGSCPRVKCPACQMGKQHVKTSNSRTIVTNKDLEMAVKRDDDEPGKHVSLDQVVCKVPGRLPNSYGKEVDSNRYTGATIFVDHASQFLWLVCQISLRAGETLLGKHAFEQFARGVGVMIRGYHADNQPFGSAEFLEDIDLQEQTITFSGVGAHHQNGVAENAVKTITFMARTMMMHQLIHWPDEFGANLWPFAMTHACYIWNHTPRSRTGLSPYELFTGVKDPHYLGIKRSRVWGCPVYVLDPTLQDGKKIPKWKKRSRLGMYVGVSDVHSSTVGRVLSLDTGYVSPQYHVVYDELFTTVYGNMTDKVFDQEEWTTLLMLHGEDNLLDPRDVRHGTEPFPSFYDDFVSDFDPTHHPRSSVSEGEHEDDNDMDSETSESEVDENEGVESWQVKRIIGQIDHLL